MPFLFKNLTFLVKNELQSQPSSTILTPTWLKLNYFFSQVGYILSLLG
jgi:hypothetical protein